MRVLVVDDEPQIRRFLKASLSAHGCEIAEAVDGQDAIRQCASWQPDVVILDLGLPDRDGIDILAEIREWSKVPIVVLSAREGEQDKIRALDAGATDYVTKPFGIGELLARLRRVVLRAKRRGRCDRGRPIGNQCAGTPGLYRWPTDQADQKGI